MACMTIVGVSLLILGCVVILPILFGLLVGYAFAAVLTKEDLL